MREGDPDSVGGPTENRRLRLEIERLRAELYEYKRAQDSLRDTEQRLREVVDHAPVVVFSVDREGVFTLSEGQGLDALGLKPGQVVGISAFEIYREFPQIQNNLRAALGGAEVNDVVKVGELVFESLYTPRRDDDGRVVGVSGVAWDVTRRVRAEDAARNLESQLLQAQKMDTIGTMAGGIAHDFNNILSPIMGYTDLARSSLDTANPAQADLEQVMLAARRAKELVEQILVFSRRSDETRRPLQLHLVVNEALKLIRSLLPSTVEISQHIDVRNDNVLADPAQMHQVIMNLCTNAAYAMRDNGGILRVELAREEVDRRAAARVACLAPGPHVVLTVRDQGAGMDEATRSRIFEPFFTTKRPGEGTGLGLSVVHGIVTSHGGAIEVLSRPGEGAAFRVFLPAATEPAVESAVNAVPAAGIGEHVLVVDDEPEIVRLLGKILESQGYRVTAFTSGSEALAAFRRAPDEFDVVVTDQTMPHLTGVELALAIHALRAAVPVVLTTGYTGQVASEALTRDIAGIATKPFDVATLTSALRAAIDGSKH